MPPSFSPLQQGCEERSGDLTVLVSLRVPWQLLYRSVIFLSPGDVVIVDAAIQALFSQQQDIPPAQLKIPSHWIRQWMPDPGIMVGKAINARTPWGKALCHCVMALCHAAERDSSGSADTLPDELGALLGLSALEFRTTMRERERLRKDAKTRLEEYVRTHCTDHDLSTERVACECAMSPRTLHRTFSAAGESYGELLIRCRLEHAFQLLTAGSSRYLSTSEIAFRSGFRDASHFARAFRSRYGQSPSGLRVALRLEGDCPSQSSPATSLPPAE